MKCKICGNYTHWDESFGYKEFIVCPKCFEKIHQSRDVVKTMDLIFELGKIARENKE